MIFSSSCRWCFYIYPCTSSSVMFVNPVNLCVYIIILIEPEDIGSLDFLNTWTPSSKDCIWWWDWPDIRSNPAFVPFCQKYCYNIKWLYIYSRWRFWLKFYRKKYEAQIALAKHMNSDSIFKQEQLQKVGVITVSLYRFIIHLDLQRNPYGSPLNYIL